MAWRNVWRNRRRTLVTVAAMSLALFVMVLYSGIIAGYLHQMERSILELEIGDVQIHADGYRANRSIFTRIDDPDAGWKGRGVWASNNSVVPWHNEGGRGMTSDIVRFQIRPDPLAD